MSGHSQEHSTSNSRSTREFAILLAIFATLLVLVFRPFGYKTFQIDLQEHNILAVILIVGIVAAVLMIMQRLGIIFADYVKT